MKLSKIASSSTITALVAALFLMLSNSVIAQKAVPLKPGDRLRVTAPKLNLEREVVTFVDLREDSLIVERTHLARREDSLVSINITMDISLSYITRLDARGRRSAVGKGALWGALVGAVAGAVAGASVDQGIGFGDTPSALFAGVGALAGGALGALIGLSIETDGWKKVPLDIPLVVSADSISIYDGKGIRIEVDKIQKIVVVIQSKGWRVIKGSVTGTSDSTIHILDKTGQQHSIHADQIKRIKILTLKKDREVKKRYFYDRYVQSLTDSTIIISKEKANR